jgi:broad-specificity NMP kinase
MLIGFTGRPGAGQSAAADYLANTHGFAVVRADAALSQPDAAAGQMPLVVIPDVETPEAAGLVHDSGGFLVHLINAHAPDLGPDPLVPLQDVDRELVVGPKVFSLYDELDTLMTVVAP